MLPAPLPSKNKNEPALDAVKKAISKTSSGEASSMDGIHAKIYKTTRPVTLDAFHDILTSVLEEEERPEYFRDGTFKIKVVKLTVESP